MEPAKYLTTKQVKERFRFSSSVTLHNWRKKRGFPNPINGRLYSITEIEQWEKEQSRD